MNEAREVSGVVHTSRGEVHYAEQGSGPCVFAVHGLPGSQRDFVRFGGLLAARGLRVIAFDLPGFAGRPLARGADPWSALSDALSEACVTIAGGPFALLAHSFGAHLAVRVATRVHDARALALLAPAGLRIHRAARSIGPSAFWRVAGKTELGKRAFRAGLRRNPVGRGVSDAGADLTLALISGADFTRAAALYRALNAPVYVATCDDDPMIELTIVEELVGALRHGELLRFPHGGHAPHKQHAEELAAWFGVKLGGVLR